jgi:hypothetical protein
MHFSVIPGVSVVTFRLALDPGKIRHPVHRVAEPGEEV